MVASTRNTRRKSFPKETSAQKRNRLRREERRERRREPVIQAVEQQPLHAPVPNPTGCEENLDLAIVAYNPSPEIVEEICNENRAAVVGEEELTTEEEAKEGEEVGMEGGGKVEMRMEEEEGGEVGMEGGGEVGGEVGMQMEEKGGDLSGSEEGEDLSGSEEGDQQAEVPTAEEVVVAAGESSNSTVRVARSTGEEVKLCN